MKKLEEFAKKRNIAYESFQIVVSKKNKLLKWEEVIGPLVIKHRRKIYEDAQDQWIVNMENGKKIWYYLRYTNLEGLKTYDFFDNKEKIEEELNEEEIYNELQNYIRGQ